MFLTHMKVLARVTYPGIIQFAELALRSHFSEVLKLIRSARLGHEGWKEPRRGGKTLFQAWPMVKGTTGTLGSAQDHELGSASACCREIPDLKLGIAVSDWESHYPSLRVSFLASEMGEITLTTQ